MAAEGSPATVAANSSLTALIELVAAGETVVLVGPDGSAKTALVPLAVLTQWREWREDIEDALAIDASDAEGGEDIPLETVLKKAGL